MLSEVGWMNKRHRPPPPDPHHVCRSVNIWASGAGCKDLRRNGQFYYTKANDTIYCLALVESPIPQNPKPGDWHWTNTIFWAWPYRTLVLSLLRMNIILVLCSMFWSQIIKLLNSAQLLVHKLGDWVLNHSGNLNVTTIWQIPFHPTLSTEKMRLFEYLQRLSNTI